MSPVIWLCALVSGANVSVDVGADRRPISEGIYGVRFGSEPQVRRMGATLRRFGGNEYSRYNWQAATTNEGGDGRWFRNVLLDGGLDEFLSISSAAGTPSVVELPLLGFVSRPAPSNLAPRTCGCSVTKYGEQVTVAPDDPLCGDCRLADGGWMPGVDPLDTSIAVDAGFLRAYVERLVDGGVAWFELGNQPALWSSTHFDVHPHPTTYAEVRERFIEAAGVVKAVSPGARTLGPSEWGWLNYFDSAAAERTAAGIDFVPYYLREARDLEARSGVRHLDYLDLHVYPMGPNPDVGLITRGDVSPAASALRLRSTRTLWDPTYAVESWESCCYDTVLKIIPRMRDWVDAGYPGTGLAISGYTWGALDHISGALALADVLGIFGREGVGLAMLEALPPDGALGEDAFKLYRSYDGAGARFGSTSVRAASDDPRVASFGSVQGDRVLLVLINKDPAATLPVEVTLAGAPGSGAYRAFGFTAAQRLAASGSGMLVNGRVTRTLPPWSAELIEVSPSGWDGGAPASDPSDAGASPDAGPDDGGPGTRGCGCSASAAPLLVGLGALLAARRRRGR